MEDFKQKKSTVANMAEQYKAEMKRLYALSQKSKAINHDEFSEKKRKSEKENIYNDFKVFDGINIYESNITDQEELLNEALYFDVEKYDSNDTIHIPKARQNLELDTRKTATTPVSLNANRVMTPQEKYEKFKLQHPQTGMLKVQAFTARRAYPVAGAEVEISKQFDGTKHVILNTKTNRVGMTEVIRLPVPQKASTESTHDTVEKPYATYHIKVEHPYFTTMNYYDVPVFQDILSIQPTDLIPKVVAPSGQKELNFYELES